MSIQLQMSLELAVQVALHDFGGDPDAHGDAL
jgi:hypothetical protein